MVIGGMTQAQIGECFGVSPRTLRKHLGDELRDARAKAIANLGASCYKRAMAGDNASTFFYLKTQGGWKETQAHEHTGNFNIVTGVVRADD